MPDMHIYMMSTLDLSNQITHMLFLVRTSYEFRMGFPPMHAI